LPEKVVDVSILSSLLTDIADIIHTLFTTFIDVVTADRAMMHVQYSKSITTLQRVLASGEHFERS